MARLTRVPWEKATSDHNVKAGFKKAGIHPFNDQKITATIYKQGLTERKLEDDTSRIAIPPAPPLPQFVLDSLPSSSPPPPSHPPRVESVSEILSVPLPPSVPSQKKKKKRKLDTTFSVMVTEKEHVDSLRAHAEEKEKKKKEKEERKIERERKKQEKQQQKEAQANKKIQTHKKKSPRFTRNKENINPNIPNNDLDPYA
jgi:flagellar biosynthesis GTPase FlhF